MISILMPIKNGIEFLRESLASVVVQTYEDWELIIGVNGYSAGSDVFKKAFAYNSQKIRVLDFPECKSKAQTLNFMVPEAQGDFLCLLDVDDIWIESKLAMQLSFIYSYDVVGSNAQYFGERIDNPAIPLGAVDSSAFRKLNPIVNTSAMFRKEDAYWEDIHGVEDYDMWCRLAVKGKTFYNVPQVLVKHRIHSGSAFNVKQHREAINEIRVRHGFV